MRKILAELLEANIASGDFLFYGDVGYGVLDKLAANFPKQVVNCGIAEQAMVCAAAGAAIASGKKVFVYSIAPFITTRCMEMIKLSVCQQKANVTIVGTGAGLSYSKAGVTHHCLEDLPLLSCIPNMQIYCPGDRQDLVEALAATGPIYIRLTEDFEVEKSNFNDDDWLDDVVVVSGTIAKYVYDLQKEIGGFDVYYVSNFQNRRLINAMLWTRTRLIFVDESYGGMKCLLPHSNSCQFISAAPTFVSECYDIHKLRDAYGIGKDYLRQTLLEEIKHAKIV